MQHHAFSSDINFALFAGNHISQLYSESDPSPSARPCLPLVPSGPCSTWWGHILHFDPS